MRSAVLAVMLLAAIRALGEASDCLNPNLIQADNRIVTSHFAGSSNGITPTYWYAFYGQAGHSYSAEFVATTDNENTNTSIGFKDLYVWGPNDIANLQQNGCFAGSSVTYWATQGYTPILSRSKYGTGQRVSFPATYSGLYILSITILRRKAHIRIGSSIQRCSTLVGAHGQALTPLGASPTCRTCR